MIIVMNVVFGAIFLRAPIRLRVVFDTVVGLIGLALVFWSELTTFDLSRERALGLILSFIGALSASLGNVT